MQLDFQGSLGISPQWNCGFPRVFLCRNILLAQGSCSSLGRPWVPILASEGQEKTIKPGEIYSLAKKSNMSRVRMLYPTLLQGVVH